MTGQTTNKPGFFEVSIENGRSLHSMKNGMGLLDTAMKMENLVKKIALIIDEQKT